MKLPEALASVFSKERSRDPVAAARALYDLDGQLGETYVAADDQGLMLFSRPLSGPPARHSFSWAEIHQAALRVASCFAFLDLHTTRGMFTLQFSPWEALTLEKMVEMWGIHGGAPPGSSAEAAVLQASAELSTPTQAEPGPLPPPLDPLVAFCAAMQTMLHCDAQVEQAELAFLSQRIPDPSAIQTGQHFLQVHGKEALLAQLETVLNEAQKQCLMANLIAVAMIDGVLQSEEQELLEQFQTALRIPTEIQQRLFQTLMAKNNLAVFAEKAADPKAPGEEDGLTPLLAYCASLLATMACDQEILPAEKDLLTLTVPYPEQISLGRDYLTAYGLDHLLERLNAVLNPAQELCLMANLIALVMVDGVIRSSEQECLDRFKQALEIRPEDYAALYDVLLLKNNLTVLAASAGS